MPNISADQKEQYARSVCYFLAELLRTHRLSLLRAAEIAQKVVENINLIDSEENFLKLVKELSSDFEELNKLSDRIQMNIHTSQRKILEDAVRGFVITILPSDTNLALAILQEAIKDHIMIEDLCVKFPQFQVFIKKT